MLFHASPTHLIQAPLVELPQLAPLNQQDLLLALLLLIGRGDRKPLLILNMDPAELPVDTVEAPRGEVFKNVALLDPFPVTGNRCLLRVHRAALIPPHFEVEVVSSRLLRNSGPKRPTVLDKINVSRN